MCVMQPSPPDTDKIRARLTDMLPELREKYGVQSLAIFGSYARGEQSRESDLDVLVDFDRLPDLYDFVAVALDLEDALGVKVDLFTRGTLKPRIVKHVLRDLQPI
jgi:uncharacterized protein